MQSDKLIFLVSQPRSGSTLLQALLSNNNAIATVSEPWLLLPFLSYQNPTVSKGTYNAKVAAEAINEFKEKIGTATFDKDLTEFLLKQYHKVVKEEGQFVLDKTPRYYEILDQIVHHFPSARIIILKRNPLAVLSSIIQTWDNYDTSILPELKRDILAAPRLLHNFAVKHATNPNVRTVHYEELVCEPQSTMRSLYQWIGIGAQPVDLDFSKNDKFAGKMGDPTGITKIKTPSAESLTKWQELAHSPKWKNFFDGYSHYLGELLPAGYGPYQFKGKKTGEFSDYLFLTEFDFDINKLPKKQLFRFFLRKKIFPSSGLSL